MGALISYLPPWPIYVQAAVALVVPIVLTNAAGYLRRKGDQNEEVDAD